jgi:WS/DGAT/MGAT family acyltransferase
MAGKTKPMTAVDAAWYHIDGPVNLAQPTGILLTRDRLDFARVKEIYQARILKFDRFHQRVVEPAIPLGTPHWEDDPHFDIEQHIHHVALPAPQDKAALMDFLSDVVSTPLDRARPLWQVYVVDGVDGGGALVMRFHHCIGDGTAMMALAQEIYDLTPDTPVDRAQPETPHPEAGLLDKMFGPALNAANRSTHLVGSTVQSALDAVLHPGRTIEAAGVVLGGVGSLVADVLKMPDPKSPIKGEFGVQKRVAWSEPVALDAIKAIGKMADAKVNDVLVAGMAGALRHYLAQRGVEVDDTWMRAMVPVDLRPRERALELGNDFGLVILDLPVSVADALQRLHVTKENMDALKRSAEAFAIKTLFNIFGRGPKALEDVAVDLFTSKTSVVMTNVAGPRQTLYVAGTPITRMMFWVPYPGKQLGMGISILSYDNSVTLAIVSDAHLVPDPEVIAEQFGREFERMLELARQEATVAPVAPAGGEAPVAPVHCAATTKQGQPCKNRPLSGSAYCRRHEPGAH